MLAKYSIRTKIITVVALLLVAMTGMGLLAVRNMRAMNANTVDIATSWMPSVRVLGDLRAGVITYRNVIREHMLSETLDEKLAAEKTLATAVEANTRIRAAYEPLITSAEERALYSEWAQLWDKYHRGTKEVMELSRKAVGQINTAAILGKEVSQSRGSGRMPPVASRKASRIATRGAASPVNCSLWPKA